MEAVSERIRTTEYKHRPDDFGSPSEAANATLQALAAPFPTEDVKFAPFKTSDSSDGEDGWAIVGPYIDARAVRRRMNAVLGMTNYAVTYREANGGLICRIEATLPDGSILAGEDGASGGGGGGDIDNTKTAVSKSLRRSAAAVLGIGEYMYKVANEVDPYFVNFNHDAYPGEQLDRDDAIGKLPKWARLMSDTKQNDLLMAAQEQGVGPEEVRRRIRQSDLPVASLDEVPISLAGDLYERFVVSE